MKVYLIWGIVILLFLHSVATFVENRKRRNERKEKEFEIPYKYIDATITSHVLRKGKAYRFSGGFKNFEIIENSDSCSIIVPIENIRIEQIGVVAEYIPEKIAP